MASWLGLGAIIVGALSYLLHIFRDNDWRGAGLMFGAMGVLPFVFLIFSSARGGWIEVKESLVYFAIDQKMPPLAAGALLMLSLLSGGFAVLYLVRAH